MDLRPSGRARPRSRPWDQRSCSGLTNRGYSALSPPSVLRNVPVTEEVEPESEQRNSRGLGVLALKAAGRREISTLTLCLGSDSTIAN